MFTVASIEQGVDQLQVIIKEKIESRKVCLLGQKSVRDVQIAAFIPHEKILLKMRTDRKEETYWAFLDMCN